MTDSFAAWINPEQAIADHDADIREPLLARIAELEGQVARVEAWYGWRRGTDAPNEALAAPAEPAGVSRELIEQVRWAEANPNAVALDEVEAKRRDTAEGGE